jgi:hypothetical protein
MAKMRFNMPVWKTFCSADGEGWETVDDDEDGADGNTTWDEEEADDEGRKDDTDVDALVEDDDPLFRTRPNISMQDVQFDIDARSCKMIGEQD